MKPIDIGDANSYPKPLKGTDFKTSLLRVVSNTSYIYV